MPGRTGSEKHSPVSEWGGVECGLGFFLSGQEQEADPEGAEPTPPKIERRLNEETWPWAGSLTKRV